jgi:hypothetical protein
MRSKADLRGCRSSQMDVPRYRKTRSAKPRHFPHQLEPSQHPTETSLDRLSRFGSDPRLGPRWRSSRPAMSLPAFWGRHRCGGAFAMSNKVSWAGADDRKGARKAAGEMGVRAGGGDARGSMGTGSSRGIKHLCRLRRALDVADHLEGRPDRGMPVSNPCLRHLIENGSCQPRAHPYPRRAGTI